MELKLKKFLIKKTGIRETSILLIKTRMSYRNSLTSKDIANCEFTLKKFLFKKLSGA